MEVGVCMCVFVCTCFEGVGFGPGLVSVGVIVGVVRCGVVNVMSGVWEGEGEGLGGEGPWVWVRLVEGKCIVRVYMWESVCVCVLCVCVCWTCWWVWVAVGSTHELYIKCETNLLFFLFVDVEGFRSWLLLVTSIC